MNFRSLGRTEGSSITNGSSSLLHILQIRCVLICGGIVETGAIGENVGCDIALQRRIMGMAASLRNEEIFLSSPQSSRGI